MDAAKVSAASDKNVRDVFEQHVCWPEGRVPFMGRVIAPLTARLAVIHTDGTAQRHNLAGSLGSQGGGD
ncbi:hypothetical protein EGD00_10785 [Pectobacterium carotovorum subsp. carotovorum]|nr:hypothetical protein EGD00_10785 [Pectobacterium carotovorum subsp. carotovorum]